MSRTRSTASSGPKISSSATARAGRQAVDDRGGDEVAVLGRLAGLMHARALVAGELQVARDALLRRGLDHRRDVDAEALRLVDQQRVDGAVQALEQRVGDALVHEHAARRRALLAREAERRVGQRGDGVVEVGVGVDDHAVLAAHLGHDALEVALAGGQLRGACAGSPGRPRPEPVNAIVCTPGCATSAAPTSPSPGRKLSTSGGTPAACSASTTA